MRATPVRVEQSCKTCGNPHETESPVCVVCGEANFVSKRLCDVCRTELTGDSCPSCWGKLPWYVKLGYRTQDAATFLFRGTKWLLSETWASLRGCASMTKATWVWGRCALRSRALSRTAFRAKYALGEKLLSAGCGDEGYRNRLELVRKQIEELRTARRSTATLKMEYDGLVMALADAGMAANLELPGVEEERKIALASQTMLRQSYDERDASRAALVPAEKADVWRAVAGYGIILVVLLLLLCIIL